MTVALLPVQVGDVWFAIDAAQVVEILGARAWVAIPDAPPQTPGVLAWRGRAVAALDLGAVTSACERLPVGDTRRRTVVVQAGEASLAIPVDAVREVREVAEELLRPTQSGSRAYATSEADLHGVLMPVLDLGAVLRASAARSASAP